MTQLEDTDGRDCLGSMEGLMNELGCVWHASCVTCETYVRKKIKIYLSTFHLIWGEREKERYRTREKEKERERERETERLKD